MGHKDSKHSWQHTQPLPEPDPTIPGKGLPGDGDDFNPKKANLPAGNLIPEDYAILPHEPDPEDKEFLFMIKSDKGQELLRELCGNSSLKNLLIQYMYHARNPEVSKALKDSIFNDQIMSFDSTSEQSFSEAKSTQISLFKFLENGTGKSAILSNLFIKMQSNELVSYLLDESMHINSNKFHSFLIDTLSRMDHEIVIPELLERQNLLQPQKEMVFTILEKISRQSGFAEMVDKMNAEAEEARYWQFEDDGSLDIDQDVDDMDNNHRDDEPLSLWDKIEIDASRVIHAVSDVFESGWVSRVFHVEWIKDAFSRAIEYLNEPSQIIDDLRFRYNQVAQSLSSDSFGIDITPPDEQRPNPISLVDFLQNNTDSDGWNKLKEFFLAYPDSENVRMLLLELSRAPVEIREKIIDLIVRMNPEVTIPVIIENDFSLAQNVFSYQKLIDMIYEQQQNQETAPEDIPDPAAIIRRKEDLRVAPEPPSNKPVPESVENPPGLLSFLDSDDRKLVTAVSVYLSSQKDVDQQLSIILNDLAIRIESDNFNETVKSNSIRMLKAIGSRGFPILLEYQNHKVLNPIVNEVMNSFKTAYPV